MQDKQETGECSGTLCWRDCESALGQVSELLAVGVGLVEHSMGWGSRQRAVGPCRGWSSASFSRSCSLEGSTCEATARSSSRAGMYLPSRDKGLPGSGQSVAEGYRGGRPGCKGRRAGQWNGTPLNCLGPAVGDTRSAPGLQLHPGCAWRGSQALVCDNQG